MPVMALQHIRRMRGGANAHLLRADDGRYYIVKFRNNPQHERILVNELISYVLLHYLRLPAPAWNLVEVRQDLIDTSPEMTMEVGRERRRCEAGLQFGSCFPGDPARRAVYDYVPASLLRMVFNVDCFCGMLAFDKWVSNADGRQAIFFRDRAKEWLSPGGEPPLSPRSLVYVASMIDHGFAFNAQNWDFVDSAEVGLYTRREVYERVRGEESFEPSWTAFCTARRRYWMTPTNGCRPSGSAATGTGSRRCWKGCIEGAVWCRNCCARPRRPAAIRFPSGRRLYGPRRREKGETSGYEKPEDDHNRRSRLSSNRGAPGARMIFKREHRS